MPETSQMVLFVLAASLLIAVPGPAVFYIVARSVSEGRWVGLASVLGVALGAMGHVSAAVLGVSAVVMASAHGFTALKLVGAAYLIYLGIRALRRGDSMFISDAGAPGRGVFRAFADGALVNLFNPKTALFFLAFLPQFVDPARGSVVFQMSLLGLIFVIIGIISDGIYALVADLVAARLGRSPGARRWLGHSSGIVYLCLGVLTLFSGRGRGA